MKGKQKTFKHRQAHAAAQRANADEDDDEDDRDVARESEDGSLSDKPAKTVSMASAASGGLDDIFGGTTSTSTASAGAGGGARAAATSEWLSASASGGLQIVGSFDRQSDQPVAELTLSNKGGVALSGFAVRFNKNAMKLQPVSFALELQSLAPGQTADVRVPLNHNGESGEPSPTIQVAVKTSAGVFYGAAQCPLFIAFEAAGKLGKQTFLEQWKALDDSNERRHVLSGCTVTAPEAVAQRLASRNVFEVARRPGPSANLTLLYASAAVDGVPLLTEFTLDGSSQIRLAIKTARVELENMLVAALGAILK